MNNLMFFKRSTCAIIIAGVTISLLMQGCGLGKKSTDGELVPEVYFDRKGWYQTIPYGMIQVPSGTFHMGQADEDVPATQINFNKQITIGGFYMDDTEITNNEYRMFIEVLKSGDTAESNLFGKLDKEMRNMPGDWNSSKLINLQFEDLIKKVYPDTMCWMRDYAHHMGDPMMEYYYAHPAFDEYPVVGVSWYAAKVFCVWRTTYLNRSRKQAGLFDMPKFRLPSEAEWEYAARGGRDLAPYPWGGPYIRNQKGCLLANFKPGRGNYYDDGFAYTAPVGAFFSNDYGLYDMAGNVSEWCEDAFNEAAYPLVWDMNPTYFDDADSRKVIRGGSWKDIAYYLQTGTRTYEYADSAKSHLGFRCAITYLGRSSGEEF
jgi:gliding motility-associated lipoprotein GldK